MIMQVEHLSKSFGGRTLFSDVTFKLEEYDRLRAEIEGLEQELRTVSSASEAQQ